MALLAVVQHSQQIARGEKKMNKHMPNKCKQAGAFM